LAIKGNDRNYIPEEFLDVSFSVVVMITQSGGGAVNM
jgi:hypothetical protein